jgi:hypothetical protein
MPDDAGQPKEEREQDRQAAQRPTKPSVAEAVAEEEGTPGTHGQQRAFARLEPLFDGATLALYAVVGALLCLLAIVALGYALYSIPENLDKGVPQAITAVLSELLLVLILVEIIRTIVTFITTHTSSVRPFLTVGAELSLVDNPPQDVFTRAMIELAAEGGLILIVAIALFLVSRREGG